MRRFGAVFALAAGVMLAAALPAAAQEAVVCTQLEHKIDNTRHDLEAGNDHVKLGAGDNMLQGGSGNDVIHGGPGNDTLIGGSGRDKIYGGPETT